MQRKYWASGDRCQLGAGWNYGRLSRVQRGAFSHKRHAVGPNQKSWHRELV